MRIIAATTTEVDEPTTSRRSFHPRHKILFIFEIDRLQVLC